MKSRKIKVGSENLLKFFFFYYVAVFLVFGYRYENNDVK